MHLFFWVVLMGHWRGVPDLRYQAEDDGSAGYTKDVRRCLCQSRGYGISIKLGSGKANLLDVGISAFDNSVSNIDS